ncbi:MAG: bifunctional phosphoglucose/phosphomannose isomerase [Dehalococcoidia bacterium]|nr:bifunctional phosphoglucose/phosphomannose isomerase [Dehalococcoidia bacterium]
MQTPSIDLDDPSLYARLDPSGMGHRLASLPHQVRLAWRDAGALALPSSYRSVDKVVLVGMGGSGVGGDLLADLLALEPTGPVFAVCRDYRLPSWVDARTLVIASSYSGNTEETLACFRDALGRSAKVVAITSGGILQQEAQAHRVPILGVNYQGEPRSALGFSFLAPLALLQGLGLEPDQAPALEEAVMLLEGASQRYGSGQPTEGNEAKRLARALEGHLVVVYGAGFLVGVARRWKTQINENAKGWALAEALPELNHNAILGYQFPGALATGAFVVLLHSPLLGGRVSARYPITMEILGRAGVSHKRVEVEGTSPLAQVLGAVALGDWTSYYVAMLNGVDPSPVDVIEYLKGRLSEPR